VNILVTVRGFSLGVQVIYVCGIEGSPYFQQKEPEVAIPILIQQLDKLPKINCDSFSSAVVLDMSQGHIKVMVV